MINERPQAGMLVRLIAFPLIASKTKKLDRAFIELIN